MDLAIYSQKSSLWTRVIKAIHGDDGKLDKDVIVGGQTCWTRVRSGAEESQFNSLLKIVKVINLVPSEDWYFWSLENEGDYSVASIRKLIDEKHFQEVGDYSMASIRMLIDEKRFQQ
nr:RNA-directed DNA polymerase, eukaryota [Tanacetum cinerariifolium]